MILSETFDVEHGPDLVGMALVCFRSFFISLFSVTCGRLS